MKAHITPANTRGTTLLKHAGVYRYFWPCGFSSIAKFEPDIASLNILLVRNAKLW